jgi:hypothetical protein
MFYEKKTSTVLIFQVSYAKAFRKPISAITFKTSVSFFSAFKVSKPHWTIMLFFWPFGLDPRILVEVSFITYHNKYKNILEGMP